MKVRPFSRVLRYDTYYIIYIYIHIYDIPSVHGLGMYGNMIELNDWSLLESQ